LQFALPSGARLRRALANQQAPGPAQQDAMSPLWDRIGGSMALINIARANKAQNMNFSGCGAACL
jgi:hypothetical protein